MKHCCDRMQAEILRNCSDGLERAVCPDSLVEYVPKYDEYGIIVHDGGRSMVLVLYCPWCGTELPESKRKRWFDELERRGVDPVSDPAPPEFQTDEWYREVG